MFFYLTWSTTTRVQQNHFTILDNSKIANNLRKINKACKMKSSYSLIPSQKTTAFFSLLMLAENEINILNQNIKNKIRPKVSKEKKEFLQKNIEILNRDHTYHLRNNNTGLIERNVTFDKIKYLANIPVKRIERFGEISDLIVLDNGNEYLIDLNNHGYLIETPQFYNLEEKKSTIKIYEELIRSHPKTVYSNYDLHKGVFKYGCNNDFFSGETVEPGELGVLVNSQMYNATINNAHKNRILKGDHTASYYCFIFRKFVQDHYEIITIRIIRGTEDLLVFKLALSLVTELNKKISLRKSIDKKIYAYDFYQGQNKIPVEDIYPGPFGTEESEDSDSNRKNFNEELQIKYGFI